MTSVELNWFKRLHRHESVIFVVQRLSVNAQSVLLMIVSFFFLQSAGIGQGNAGQVDGSRGGIDWRSQSVVNQSRQHANMIEVSVGNNDRIEISRNEWKWLPVAIAEFTTTLEHSAVDKDLGIAHRK